MGIALGLLAAFGWGAADLMARYSTRSVGSYRALFYMQFVGLVALTIFLAFTGEFALLWNAGAREWLWTLFYALISITGALALYRAFEVGKLAIVSPIVSSYAALTVILAFLSGEHLAPQHGVGVGITLVGVVLTAIHVNPTQEHSTERQTGMARGVGWALLASLGFGVTFWILGFFITPVFGGILPVWLVRLSTVVLLPLLAIPMRQSMALPHRASWRHIAALGVLDTAAFAAASIGFTTDQVAIVSVISSLFTAVTVVLAWIVLREPLQRNQWLGVGVIIVGIVLVSS